MNVKNVFVRIQIVVALSFVQLQASNLIFGSKDSTIHINSGANFIIENAIDGVDGQIIKETDANIEGAQITFNNGVFAESNDKMQLTGQLNLNNLRRNNNSNGNEYGIVLNGDKAFTGQSGKLDQPIYVSKKNNMIDGNATLIQDVTLQDLNTSLSIDLLCNIKSNINLNGGILYISQDDLQFNDNQKIVGPGKIFLNGNKLIFGAKELTFDQSLYFVEAGDITFNDRVSLETCWTFSGNCILEGGNNFLCMACGGKIIVERGSSLLLKNLVLHGVGPDSLFCMDNYGTVTLQNVDVYFDSDYTFSVGHFDFLNSVYFCGNHKFTYNSSKQSTIYSRSTLYLDTGMTFSYDSTNMQKDLLIFQDQSSCLAFNGATLHATLGGMQLTNGTLIVTHNSYLYSEKNSLVDEGITFGNDNADNDFCCRILNGARLEITAGSLKYRNIERSAWFMENNLSWLEVAAGCNLYLYQNLDLGLGTLNYKGRGGFFRAPGKNLTGAFGVVDYLDYRTL